MKSPDNDCNHFTISISFTMSSTKEPKGEANSPFLIPGLKFFTDPESNNRPGNLFSEKLHSDYHNNPETGYHIPFAPIGDPGNRRLKVITIGAGLAGVMLAYNIEKHCPNVEHVIYEKNPTVGGTWVRLFFLLLNSLIS